MDDSKGKRRLVGALITATLLAGACTSSDDDGTFAPLTPAETSEAQETTTTTQTTTTETTVNETAFADMERPELEIQTEWESDLDEIFGRYLMYWEALYNALGPPRADPNYQPLLELLGTDVAVEDVQAQVQGFQDRNEVVIRTENSLDDHGLRLPNPSVLEKTEGNLVVIQDCWIRDDVTRFLDGKPSDEAFSTVLWNVTMVVDDGEWKYLGAAEADERSDGYQECQDLFDTLEK